MKVILRTLFVLGIIALPSNFALAQNAKPSNGFGVTSYAHAPAQASLHPNKAVPANPESNKKDLTNNPPTSEDDVGIIMLQYDSH